MLCLLMLGCCACNEESPIESDSESVSDSLATEAIGSEPESDTSEAEMAGVCEFHS